MAAPGVAEDTAAPALAPSEIVAAAPKSDWTTVAPSDLLVMDLAPDAKGKPRRVVIQLMPAPFSQGWIGNIRKLAAAHFWDGLSVNRVQDNYVVQWGDANAGDDGPTLDAEKLVAERIEAYRHDHPRAGRAALKLAERQFRQAVMNEAVTKAADALDRPIARPLPEGLAVVPERDYLVRDPRKIPIRARLTYDSYAARDAYADYAMPFLGWPLAFFEDGIWPVHCYGMVGVGRNLSPDTGSGAELYAVIGHAPRHLDRNIALVGRVIEGIEHLSSLPRGTEALGVYKTAEERTTIQSVRIGTEVAGLPAYEYLSTESESFARYADARANRRDAFFIRPAGGADLCNIPVPVRRSAGAR
ncbi:MAG: peptidylprolyl isomerase [Novosphingobium sp.]